MREIVIAGTRIADDTDCWTIAEVGSNHQGSVPTAKELIRQAKAAGADAVKFQKRDNRTLYPPEMYDRPYQSENAFGPTYGLHREALELSEDAMGEIKEYAESLGLVFFATPFDRPSVDLLERIGVPCYKVASFDVRSLDLIRYIAAKGRPMIVSTGSATEKECADALDASARGRTALLHCTTIYPATAETLNLRAITTMRDAFPNTVIGYSSHFSGISMPLVAYVLGARILEVHFTLNRAMKGTDHAFSLEPDGLRKLVRDLARARAAMGDGIKRMLPEELPALQKQGRAPK